MKARPALVSITCILLFFCASAAGCICIGPGTEVPTPSPPAGTPVLTVSPKPEPAANLSGWGTDGDTYARNATATGWVDVSNAGSVPIDQVDFTIVIKRTILFVPVEKAFSYSATNLDIRPGETKKVQFGQVIPAEYQGISTAGDYRLVVTASIAGKEVGSYSKDITVA
jgi:hypothetical protein